MVKAVENEVDGDLEDFFTEEGLNKPIQLRVENIPLGKHKLKFISLALKKARINEKTKKAGVDRIEATFEYVESSNPKCLKGSKGTIPYFQDAWQFGEKGLVKFAQQGINDPSDITGKEAITILKECYGLEIDCVCSTKEKAGTPILNKKQEPILEYNFGSFRVE